MVSPDKGSDRHREGDAGPVRAGRGAGSRFPARENAQGGKAVTGRSGSGKLKLCKLT